MTSRLYISWSVNQRLLLCSRISRLRLRMSLAKGWAPCYMSLACLPPSLVKLCPSLSMWAIGWPPLHFLEPLHMKHSIRTSLISPIYVFGAVLPMFWAEGQAATWEPWSTRFSCIKGILHLNYHPPATASDQSSVCSQTPPIHLSITPSCFIQHCLLHFLHLLLLFPLLPLLLYLLHLLLALSTPPDDPDLSGSQSNGPFHSTTDRLGSPLQPFVLQMKWVTLMTRLLWCVVAVQWDSDLLWPEMTLNQPNSWPEVARMNYQELWCGQT
jgi:hypothetical protein